MTETADRTRQQAGTTWRETYYKGSLGSESTLIQSFIAQIGEVQAKNRQKGNASTDKRAFHAKNLASVTNAEFRISPDIPSELQIGPFQPGKKYEASVRLSNASGFAQSDPEKDLRGAAFRITADEGQIHDFLMTNADPNHARDALQFMKIAVATAKARSSLGSVINLMLSLGPFEAVRVIRTVSKQIGRKVKSLCTETYWSRAPIKFGDFAVKYSLHPIKGLDDTSRAAGKDYLRQDFIFRLRDYPVTFDFKVQRFVNETRTPIEDGSVKWDAELETVAQLIIPKQDLLSPEGESMNDEVNKMAFNPWNSTDDFRPLGSLNRARKIVYETSANNRSG